jgi:hypothetical protein
VKTVRYAAVVGVCLAAALAGCGSSNNDHADRPAAKRTTPPAKQQPKTPSGPVAMGQKTSLGGTVEATVFEYRQPSVTGGPTPGPAGYTWGSADVQVCTLTSAKANVTVDWKTWSLRYADNSVLPAGEKNDNAFPRPEYPFTSRPLAAGECVRGWITFAVPANGRPTVVEYQPHGLVASWTVPAPATSAGSASPTTG